MQCQSKYHYALTPYFTQIIFEDNRAQLMFEDPKSLVHGLHNGEGLGENGIREHTDLIEDRGPKLPDGTYDQKTIQYNRKHASEMVAQYLTSDKFTFTLVSDEDGIHFDKRKLRGELVVDAVGQGEKGDYELSYLRFRVGSTCIELTLTSYGFKFEEHNYKWVVSHVCDEKEEYYYHDYVASGEMPKYNIQIDKETKKNKTKKNKTKATNTKKVSGWSLYLAEQMGIRKNEIKSSSERMVAIGVSWKTLKESGQNAQWVDKAKAINEGNKVVLSEIQYYILVSSYEGKLDINSDNIVCVGSKSKLNSYICSQYLDQHINTSKLFCDGHIEIDAEKRLYLLEHRVGYAVMAFCPGGTNELEWFIQEDDAIKRLSELEKQYSMYDDDEYVYSMRLYRIGNEHFEVLRAFTTPYGYV